MAPTVYSPPVSTYIALATTTLSATASSVTFSSIPATYRDLILVAYFKTSAVQVPRIRLNSDTGSNYSQVNMHGDGSSALSNTASGTWFGFGNYMTSDTQFGTRIAQIMDASATDKHKTVLMRSSQMGSSYDGVEADAGRWASTSAVNTVTMTLSSGTYEVGSTFSLYGIAS